MKLIKDKKGVSSVEYALMVALVSVAAFTASDIGAGFRNAMNRTEAAFQEKAGPEGPAPSPSPSPSPAPSPSPSPTPEPPTCTAPRVAQFQNGQWVCVSPGA